MAAKSTTTNSLILQQRKTWEQELERKKTKLAEYRSKIETIEVEIIDIQEALDQLPDSVPSRPSQQPTGEES